jgi:ABC-type multidrug transport system fused ATPase/permease subunit
MVLFLFNNVIYVFLLLWLRILIVCLCMTTLTEGFLCFFLSCKANARVKPAKTGHGPHSSQLLCCTMYFFVLFYVFFYCSMYFCVVLCIVCFVTFPVLFVCIYVLNNCHRVATQLQLNISHHLNQFWMSRILVEKCINAWTKLLTPSYEQKTADRSETSVNYIHIIVALRTPNLAHWA